MNAEYEAGFPTVNYIEFDVVKRTAEVIPKITKKIQGSKMEAAIEAPKVCKHCGSPVVIKDSLPWCSNKTNCQEALIQHLMHFASKPVMDIKGLGEKICRKLVESGAIKTIADIYNLAADSMLEYEITSSEITANMLEVAISKASVVKPHRLLIALGIPKVSEATAKAMVDIYTDVKKHDTITKEQWLLVPSVGEEVANSIVSWFADPDNLAHYKRLCEVLVISVTVPKVTSNKLARQCWILTGGVEGYTRVEIERLLIANGAKVASDYNDKVTHCYVGTRPGSILTKCARDGVIIVEHSFTGAKFLEALEDNTL